MNAYDIVENSTLPIRSVIGRASAGQPLEIVGDEEEIDFNYLLAKGSRNTLAVQLDDEAVSMCPEIQPRDWLVLALDKEPKPNDIVMAEINGLCTVKRFKLSDRRLFLVASNASVPTREVHERDDFRIIGVVKGWAHIE